MDAYAYQMDGNYLSWIEALELPASNDARIAAAKASIKKTWAREDARRRCIADNAEIVQKWLDGTGTTFKTEGLYGLGFRSLPLKPGSRTLMVSAEEIEGLE